MTVTRIPEDNDVDPFYIPPALPAVEPSIQGTQVPLRQMSMIEFVSLNGESCLPKQQPDLCNQVQTMWQTVCRPDTQATD